MVELKNFRFPEDPEQAFAAVVALRRLADRMEAEAVSTALQQGWSWSKIAQALGISKQAAHKRLSHLASRHNNAI